MESTDKQWGAGGERGSGLSSSPLACPSAVSLPVVHQWPHLLFDGTPLGLTLHWALRSPFSILVPSVLRVRVASFHCQSGTSWLPNSFHIHKLSFLKDFCGSNSGKFLCFVGYLTDRHPRCYVSNWFVFYMTRVWVVYDCSIVFILYGLHSISGWTHQRLSFHSTLGTITQN